LKRTIWGQAESIPDDASNASQWHLPKISGPAAGTISNNSVGVAWSNPTSLFSHPFHTLTTNRFFLDSMTVFRALLKHYFELSTLP
jgi:hypothetical protein